VPPVLELESAAEGGAGQQVERTGLANVLEQPGALARQVGTKVMRYSSIRSSRASERQKLMPPWATM
jgi:hypothetical protein